MRALTDVLGLWVALVRVLAGALVLGVALGVLLVLLLSARWFR
jgi:hypothetical protein